MRDHGFLPGRTEHLRDEEPSRRRSAQRWRPAAVPASGESAGRHVRWDGTVTRPAAGTPVEQCVTSVEAGTARRMWVDVFKARECRECNGWGSLVEDGRAELCPTCQYGRHATEAVTVVPSGKADTASTPRWTECHTMSKEISPDLSVGDCLASLTAVRQNARAVTQVYASKINTVRAVGHRPAPTCMSTTGEESSWAIPTWN
ncbi:hypothetical protein GCM10022207_93890 [Streptomyces lannensis]|uniref:Uncharacterized protein n=1 Tax=Streptomyces lannensis TaxID=766498 RepID=A0ABP7LW48_9ACTN